MGQAVIPGDFKRSYKRSPYDSGVLVSLTHCSQVYTLQSTDYVLTRSRLPSFLSILAHFPKPKFLVTLNRIQVELMLTSYTTSEEENRNRKTVEKNHPKPKKRKKD